MLLDSQFPPIPQIQRGSKTPGELIQMDAAVLYGILFDILAFTLVNLVFDLDGEPSGNSAFGHLGGDQGCDTFASCITSIWAHIIELRHEVLVPSRSTPVEIR